MDESCALTLHCCESTLAELALEPLVELTSCQSFQVAVSATLELVPSVFAVLYVLCSFCSTRWSVVTTVTVCTFSDDGTTSMSGTGNAATSGWFPGGFT